VSSLVVLFDIVDTESACCSRTTGTN